MIETSRNLSRSPLHRPAVAGGLLLLFITFAGLLAPLIAPHDPKDVDLGQSLMPPSAEFPLGTNRLGRCVLSQLLYGGRITLGVSVAVVAATAAIGLAVGLISGYFGGLVDDIIMRLVDMVLALPAIILALIIVGSLGPGIGNLMIAMAATSWTGYARVVRSAVVSLKETGFVESAKALGASPWYILRVHLLPNSLSSVIVLSTFGMAQAILAISALSFLGLGAQPPEFDWGSMLRDGVVHMRSTPHLVIFPGLAIMLSVLAFNFLGDGLRDYLDRKFRRGVEW